jgi:poly-beta-1,6-N-acetyl-D-glucosamine synthase
MADYVVITPAHDEEKHLEKVIWSMLAQSRKPLRWVIVNDNSSDRTGEIAERYAGESDFISVITIRRQGSHGFNKKAGAFNAAVATLRGLSYDYIGNLDADISLEINYFENMLRAFERDPRLGITGGIVFTTIGNRSVTHDQTLDSVAGAVQMFRRQCFEDIGGGYLLLPFGGIDAAAEIIAKERGWRVAKQPEFKVCEHRQTGTATMTPLASCFRLGRRFHSLGYGILFYIARCFHRLGDEPVLIGSCAALLGYFESLVRRRPILLPPEVVQHLRQEQHRKLCHSFSRFVRETYSVPRRSGKSRIDKIDI